MPITEDLIQQVGESAHLSKADLSKGFCQIPLKETDRDKAAFCTPFGKYRFVRMPFGLMGAPATFQRTMDGVLEGQHDYSTVYIDNILIFSAYSSSVGSIEAGGIDGKAEQVSLGSE